MAAPLVRSLLLAGLLSAPPAAAQIVFEPPVISDGGLNPSSVVAGDVNEDGFADAIVSYGPVTHPITAPTLCLGTGDGHFAAPVTIPQLGISHWVARLLDLNGDTHLDLLTVASGGDSNFLLGDGHGVFGAVQSFTPSGLLAQDADAGDVNGDGNVDVIVFRKVGSSTRIDVALGHGNGSFDAFAAVATVPLMSIANEAVGDVTGDGFDDIAVRYIHEIRVVHGAASVGTWPVTTTVDAPALDATFLLALADLDNDGRDDELTSLGYSLAAPDGSFGPTVIYSTYTVGWVTSGDFDGDGNADVALSAPPSSRLLVRRGHGDGTLEAPLVVSNFTQYPFTVANVDGDGRADLVGVGAPSSTSHASLCGILNHTYAAGSPFLDLGFSLGGSAGTPVLLADGSLLTGTPYSFRLVNGTPNGAAVLVVGVSRIDLPFKGGTLVPSLTLITGALPLDAAGAVTLGGTWPAGASGAVFYMQFWMPQTGTPLGFAGSTGLRVTVP